jgi:hypothetical protein
MKAVKIRQVRQLLIIKLVPFHGGLTALNIAIREEFMLKKLSISIDFIIT